MHSGFTSPQTCENAFKCWLQDSIFIKKKIENIIIIRYMILKLKCLEIQGLAVLNVKFWLDVYIFIQRSLFFYQNFMIYQN